MINISYPVRCAIIFPKNMPDMNWIEFGKKSLRVFNYVGYFPWNWPEVLDGIDNLQIVVFHNNVSNIYEVGWRKEDLDVKLQLLTSVYFCVFVWLLYYGLVITHFDLMLNRKQKSCLITYDDHAEERGKFGYDAIFVGSFELFFVFLWFYE